MDQGDIWLKHVLSFFWGRGGFFRAQGDITGHPKTAGTKVGWGGKEKYDIAQPGSQNKEKRRPGTTCLDPGKKKKSGCRWVVLEKRAHS